MADEFFRRLEIPYFDDDFMEDIVASLDYRVDRRFFDNDLIDGTKEILTSGPSFSPVWDFSKSSRLITNPLDFLCIKPYHQTGKRSDQWQRFKNCYSMLYLPIMPRRDTKTSVMLYETPESVEPVAIASCEFGVPLLFNSSKKWYVIRNESQDWAVGLRFIFHAEYELVLDLIADGKLFTGIDVNLVNTGMV